MKKIVIFSLMLWLMPQVMLAATVTENVLDKLGCYDRSWQGFLKKPETTTWQCGEIEGSTVRYSVNGDVIGYDEVNHVWWHLFTPISTVLPIEALALRMDGSGKVTSQIVTLRKSICEKSRVKTASEKVTVEPVAKVVAAERKTVPIVQQKCTKVQKNTDTLTVSSTWELMELYLQETGEER